MKKKYRILCAIDSLTGGGAERVLSQLLNRLDPDQFELYLVLTLGDEIRHQIASHVKILPLVRPEPKVLLQSQKNQLLGFSKRILINKLPLTVFRKIIYNYRHLKAIYKSTFLFGQYVQEIKPDCILCFLPLTNLICILARRRYHLQVPIILSDRNHLSIEINNLPCKNIHKICIRTYYPKIERHIAVSKAAADDLANNFGVSSKRISYIYNGVDQEFLAKAALEPIPFKLNSEQVHLVSAGRLNPQKGFDLLLDALAQIKSKNWCLWLLGSGSEEKKLLQKAAANGIKNRVVFIGFDANPWRWFSRADIFIMSSRWEGLPNALIEAMALGLPVISTNCPGGPAEILENGRWGKLVAPDSPEALARAIDTLIIDPKQLTEFARRSRERALDFSIDHMVDKYTKLLHETIRMKDFGAS